MKTKAYSYIRMSTDRQGQGDSQRRQHQLAVEFCERNNLELDDQLTLVDIGFSAFKGDHIEKGSLGQFLQAVREEKVPQGSIFLIESHDRLSRMEPRKALTVFLELLNSGISIAVLNQGKIFRPESQDEFEIFQAIIEMVRSHGESQRKSDMLAASWQRKRSELASRVMTALAPGWLKMKQDRSGFDVIPERKETVQLMFDLAGAHNMGSYAIARELNKRGLQPFGRANRGWQKSSVQKVLANRAVIGEFEPHKLRGSARTPSGQIAKAYFPPVIAEELFFKIQSKRQERRLRGGGRLGGNLPNLFTKMARCGYCGGPIHFVNKGKRGGTSLVCDTGRRAGPCHTAHWPYDHFESSVMAFVREVDVRQLLGDFVHKDELAHIRDDITVARGRLEQAQNRRRKIFELLTGPQSTRFLQDQFSVADQEVAQLESQLKEQQTRELSLRSENVGYTEGGQTLLQLLNEVKSKDAVSYVAFRHRLRAALVSVVDELKLYPLGTMPVVNRWTPGVEVVRDGDHEFFVKDGIAFFSSQGSRNSRYFTIGLKDGTMRRVKPNADDPQSFDWIGEGSANPITRKQVMEMARRWGLDPANSQQFEEARKRLNAMVTPANS